MAGPVRGRLRTDCGDLTCSKSDTSRTRGPLAVWRGMVACSPVRQHQTGQGVRLFTQELSGDVGPGARSGHRPAQTVQGATRRSYPMIARGVRRVLGASGV